MCPGQPTPWWYCSGTFVVDDHDVGDRVHVEDPNLSPLFSPFVGTVVYVNGDMVDVEDDDGDIDCFPAAWVVKLGSP